MSFSKEQIELLNMPLDKNRVASREKAGMKLSYLEGYDVMDYANKVFGFEKWSYIIQKLEKVNESTNAKGNAEISYIAIVRTSVSADQEVVIREDVGYGNGVAKSVGDAYESATKEAVTDALKRAMRGFGNGFGLALYDKQQKNVKEFTAQDVITQVKNIDPTAKVLSSVNYKDAIVELMIKLGVKDTEIANCAASVMDAGLDIKNDPKHVYEECRELLEDTIKLFASLG